MKMMIPQLPKAIVSNCQLELRVSRPIMVTSYIALEVGGKKRGSARAFKSHYYYYYFCL